MIRPARLLLVGLPLLLALGLAAAWLLPPRLDWSRYRAAITTLASERLGREVRIAGPISLTVLPEPALTAGNVSLADAGDGIAVTAAQLRLRVALGALARGRIDAEELVLRGADVRVPWPIRPIRIADRAPGWFAVASVRIEDSRLSIGHLAFSGIQATLTTDAWTGSYAAAGMVGFSDRTWQFTARLTRAGQDGSAGLDLSLDGRGAVRGVGAKLSGQIQGDGRFGGRLTGRGPDLSQLLPAPAVAFTIDGRVSAAGGLAAVDKLSGEIGGVPVKGAVAVRVLPAVRADIALSTGRLDLDSWAPALLHGGPAPFPVGIDLSAEAAQLAGGTLRRLRGAFDVGGGSIAVRQARAVLPGDATLAATGAIDRQGSGGKPRFEGDVAVSAPAARTTLAWLENAGLVPRSVLPEGVLRNAEWTTRAVVEPGRLTLDRLDGRADGTHLSGNLAYRVGPQPSLAAVLQADQIDLDGWLPASWPLPAAIPPRLKGMDADLRIVASRVMLQGTMYGPLSLDAAVDAGRLGLRRLELGGGGLRLVASGTLDEKGRLAGARLDVQAPTAGALVALLAPDRVSWCDALRACKGAVSLSAQASGPPDALALHVVGDLADLRLEAQQTIDIGGRRASGTLTLRHPGAPRLAESLGLSGAPAWLGDGSLGLVAQLSVQLPGARPGRVGVESFDLSAGSLHANGSLALDDIGATAEVPRLTGRILADTLPLPLPSPRAVEPLGFGVLKGWQANLTVQAAQLLAGSLPVLRGATARVALAGGKLTVEGLSARLGDGRLSGGASIDVSGAVPQVALQAEISGVTLDAPLFGPPVDIASGRLDASAAFSASGYSPAAMASTLSGESRLVGVDGTLSGVSLGDAGSSLSDAALERALAGGTTAFSRLDLALRAERGVLQVVAGRMVGPAGTVGLTGSVDLPGDAADLRLGLRPAVIDPPEIGLRLAGPLEALHREPELAAAALWRAEHAAVPE